jgi:hypothetical protein
MQSRQNLARTAPTLGVLPEDWDVNASSTWSDDVPEIPEDAVLEGVLQIASTMFHVRAMRVVDPDARDQTVVDSAFTPEFEAVLDICGDGPLETVKIDGHDGEYVVVIYPFAT